MSGGVQGYVCPGGVWEECVCVSRCVCPKEGIHTPRPKGRNITLPKTSFAGGNHASGGKPCTIREAHGSQKQSR